MTCLRFMHIYKVILSDKLCCLDYKKTWQDTCLFESFISVQVNTALFTVSLLGNVLGTFTVQIPKKSNTSVKIYYNVYDFTIRCVKLNGMCIGRDHLLRNWIWLDWYLPWYEITFLRRPCFPEISVICFTVYERCKMISLEQKGTFISIVIAALWNICKRKTSPSVSSFSDVCLHGILYVMCKGVIIKVFFANYK